MALTFSERLLTWWQTHGRHDLPWQLDRTPYRVWVSEIMLQQTQVATVIDYFNRFMARFPTLKDLAHAEVDEVLALWSGLGYYARARNLHRSAVVCLNQYQGHLPEESDQLQALPGIGRSTANAILAQAHNQRAVILDGNVKRVLARHEAIEGWPGLGKVEKALWAVADRNTPDGHAADYTQAIMDLGATVCRRAQPHCEHCPVATDCQARIQGLTAQLPTPKPRVSRPVVELSLGIFINSDSAVWLEKQPDQGIWGGLWSFPVISEHHVFEHLSPGPAIEPMTHLLTHRTLALRFDAWFVQDESLPNAPSQGQWHGLNEAQQLGVPQPIKTTLLRLEQALELLKSTHG